MGNLVLLRVSSIGTDPLQNKTDLCVVVLMLNTSYPCLEAEGLAQLVQFPALNNAQICPSTSLTRRQHVKISASSHLCLSLHREEPLWMASVMYIPNIKWRQESIFGILSFWTCLHNNETISDVMLGILLHFEHLAGLLIWID